MLYDKDIREPLFEFLEEKYGKIRILEEHNMGRSRADIIMIRPSALYGIEIKSDADTYARLEGQVHDYDLYYDYNIVVVGSTHGAHIADHVPEHWGIITIEEKEIEGNNNIEGLENTELDFYILREPAPNPHMKMANKISILWRPELAHIQEITGMAAYKQLSKKNVALKIIEKLPEDQLQELTSEELFERDYTTIRDTINEYRVAQGRKPKQKRRRRRRKRVVKE